MFNALLLLLTFATSTGITTLAIDPSESEVTWKGYKVTGSHEGDIKVKDGHLEVQSGKLTGGSVTIDMTTINATDIDGEYGDKLEGHLRSDDFFGVVNHPTATILITDVKSLDGQGKYSLTGELTIKGTTKEIIFPATLEVEDGQLVAIADVKVDRSKFNIRYGSGSFFDNLGDKTIYDEFDLHVRLVTKN